MTDDQLSLDDLLAEAQAARDTAIALVDEATDEWQRQTIDHIIRTVAQRGVPFTANDCRPLLPPGIKGNRVSARFYAWSKSGAIVKTGRYVTSTDPGTHCAEVKEWIGVEYAHHHSEDAA